MPVGIVTVKLPKDLYVRLDALAKQEKTDLVALLDRLATSAAESSMPLESSTSAFERILYRATDLGVTDLAGQHDHYTQALTADRHFGQAGVENLLVHPSTDL